MSNDTKLALYSYYKQATVGDCNTGIQSSISLEKPGMFAMTEKAKWEAWNSKKGMSKDEAKNQYVAVVKANVPESVAVRFQ